MGWLKSLFAPRPCTCHGCDPRPINKSRSPNVSHGLDLWIGKDGKTHWRATSRIVDQ
jgi:hypothetical protein